MINIKYLVWALLAGSFIPLVGILNGRAGRVLGDSLQASVVLFVVTLLLAVAVAVLLGRGLPGLADVTHLHEMLGLRIAGLRGHVITGCGVHVALCRQLHGSDPLPRVPQQCVALLIATPSRGHCQLSMRSRDGMLACL